jgi:cytochrome P450
MQSEHDARDPGGAPDLYWDPFDTAIDTDPYECWRRLRDEAPVYRNDRYDFYALSRFVDVEAASRDARSFSSAHGTVLELMSPTPGLSGMLIFMDPPDHTRMRSLVSRAFTPRRVTRLEDRIRELCNRFLDAALEQPSFDFVQDFAARLPAMVIASLFGVPEPDQEGLRKLIDTVFHIEEGVGMVNNTSLTAGIEIHGYICELLRDRTENPRDDMLTDLTVAEITEPDSSVRRLTIPEAADFAFLLISAGTETVARLLGWAAVLLDRHPDQRDVLIADPGLIGNAVEELLRYEAPSPVNGRWLTRDVELHGQVIPEGSKVLLLTGSAGRDEREYPDADRFDVRRQFDHHVSFGHGIHFCIGAALARLEGRVALEETLRRMPSWTVDIDHAVRLHTSTVRGWVNVPVGV